jgi:hypothetical protein
MSETVADAHRRLIEAIAVLQSATDNGTDEERLAALRVNEGILRQLTVHGVQTTAELTRRGAFTERGYKSPTLALTEQLGIEYYDARLRVTATQQVCPRVGFDGAPLPPLLPATAAAFAAGQLSLRHIDVITKVMGSKAAARVDPEDLAVVEANLAENATVFSPAKLHEHGMALVNLLDQDGAEPDDGEPEPVNKVRIRRHRDKPGGTITGTYESAAQFAAINALLDAKSKPLDTADQRSLEQRLAEALADTCAYVLNHGDLPHRGGQRPRLNAYVSLQDLESRAQAAMLDFGGLMTPSELRLFACDCGVVPVVLGGNSELLDVGRTSRSIPEHIRRALVIRDGGCAWPGCDRPPSWTEAHHIVEWSQGGVTSLDNCVLLCGCHHRVLHASEWVIRLRGGFPEFIPPRWVDPDQVPRRKPSPHMPRAACGVSRR